MTQGRMPAADAMVWKLSQKNIEKIMRNVQKKYSWEGVGRGSLKSRREHPTDLADEGGDVDGEGTLKGRPSPSKLRHRWATSCKPVGFFGKRVMIHNR